MKKFKLFLVSFAILAFYSFAVATEEKPKEPKEKILSKEENILFTPEFYKRN